MKIIISEKLKKRINYKDLCSEFSVGSESNYFCRSVESALKNTLSHVGKSSINFFHGVMRNGVSPINPHGRGPFRVMKLDSYNPEHIKRMDQLKNLKTILDKYNVCSKLRVSVENEIEKLDMKGLSMVVDENGEYSFLNKLDGHYSGKAYILTKLFIRNKLNFVKETDSNGNLKIVTGKLVDFFKDPNNQILVANEIADLIRNDEEFDVRLTQGMLATVEEGNKIETLIKDHLRKKGYELIDFSSDFGYVDYLGIDGVVIIDGVVKPYQISKSLKNKKIFKYHDNDCDVLHYTFDGKKVKIIKVD